MASCDDDFPLLPDDRHHHQHHQQQQQSHPQFQHQSFYRLNRFINKVATAPTARSPIRGGRDEGSERFADLSFTAKCASAFPDVAPFSGDEEVSPYAEEEGEEEEAPNQSSRRKEREEVSDGTALYKRSKIGESAAPGGGDYRRDREEWSDTAIGCLLEAYMSKYAQLNKGNLRGRDWEEVAGMVREGCQKQAKSVEQCKNKVDNLKKRYKLERHRMSSGGVSTSHWPWFKKMEEIFGDLVPRNTADLEEDKAVQSSSRQAKRYLVATANPVSPLLNVRMKQAPRLRWRRVVFKISGVALAGSGSNNFDPEVATLIASEVAKASRAGVEVAIVVGGRNLFCGDTWVTATGSDRSTAYQIGMMATVMNSILLQSAMEKMGIQARVQSGLVVQESAEPYNRQRAIRHLEKGRIVIFGGVGVGIGNPLFSTDTAAALRASEIHAEAVLKGTNADGLYGCNSGNNNIFEHISFRALGSRGANVMDMMALSYCEENSIPVVVFNLLEPGNISKAICGEQVGTLIDQTGRIS